MKNILHLYSENTLASDLSALVSRTQGTVQNIGVFLPQNEGCVATPVPELSIPVHSSPTPLDSTKHFQYDQAVRKCAAFVGQQVNLSEVSLIHAHSLLAGGTLAHALHLQHGIPYIAAVTMEDIRFWHDSPLRSRKLLVPVLEKATRVIFLNNNFQDFVASRLSDSDADRIFSRALTLHNGLDPFWLQNIHIHKPVSMIHIRLLIAGDQLSPKSLPPVLKAVQLLRKRNYDVSLTVVGCTQQSAVDKDPSVRFLPSPTREGLFQILRESDIYITPAPQHATRQYYAEALSQGLPLLYDPHNGPDGLSPDGKIGYATHTHSADDLAEKILLVGERYATIEQHITDLHPLHLFNWDEIYRGYLRVYDSAGGV